MANSQQIKKMVDGLNEILRKEKAKEKRQADALSSTREGIAALELQIETLLK